MHVAGRDCILFIDIFSNSSVAYSERYFNTIIFCSAVIYMLDKIWLPAVYEVGKLIEYSDCQSRIERLTSRTGVGANSYLLNCLINFISAERK